MTTTIYHNPRCSKSRQTLQLLQENNIQPEIIEYLQSPPTKKELDEILNLLGIEPRELIRKKEPEYKALNLDDESLSREEIIAIMVKHPKLIERPIVIHNNQAEIGRPPEKVLEII
jgi:arsenate reductase